VNQGSAHNSASLEIAKLIRNVTKSNSFLSVELGRSVTFLGRVQVGGKGASESRARDIGKGVVSILPAADYKRDERRGWNSRLLKSKWPEERSRSQA